MTSWDEIRTAFQVARLGTVSAAAEALGVRPGFATPEVVKEVYEWASVTPLRREEAA